MVKTRKKRDNITKTYFLVGNDFVKLAKLIDVFKLAVTDRTVALKYCFISKFVSVAVQCVASFSLIIWTWCKFLEV